MWRSIDPFRVFFFLRWFLLISFQRDIFIVFFSSGGFKRAAVAAIVWDSGGRRISIGVRYFATEMTDDGVAPVSSGVHRSANRISSAISHSSRRRLHAFFFFLPWPFLFSFHSHSTRLVRWNVFLTARLHLKQWVLKKGQKKTQF